MEREQRELETSLLRMGVSLKEINSLGLDKLDVKSPSIKDAFNWDDTPQGWMFWNRLNNRQLTWMEMREHWRFWTERLFVYAHALDCSEAYSCPEEHIECSKRLGIDTALAWRLAQKVDANGPTREVQEFIAFANSVVLLHREKYPTLDYLILGLYYAVRREL